MSGPGPASHLCGHWSLFSAPLGTGLDQAVRVVPESRPTLWRQHCAPLCVPVVHDLGSKQGLPTSALPRGAQGLRSCGLYMAARHRCPQGHCVLSLALRLPSWCGEAPSWASPTVTPPLVQGDPGSYTPCAEPLASWGSGSWKPAGRPSGTSLRWVQQVPGTGDPKLFQARPRRQPHL